MEKNQTSKWVVFAYGLPDHANPGQAITGDAANITANIRIDGGAANAVDDTNPTELEDGYYIFDTTAAESNGDNLLLAPASSTANVQVIAVPGAVYTRPPNFNDISVVPSTGEVGIDFNNVNLPVGSIPALGITDNGTLVAFTTTTADLRASADFPDTNLRGKTIEFTSATTGAGQSRLITTNTLANDRVTFDALDTALTGTVKYAIYGTPPSSSTNLPDVNTVEVGGITQTANDNGADINTLLSRLIGTIATGTHNPASAAQIAVLSDWINDGRLDVILDAIKAKTDSLIFTVANQVDSNVVTKTGFSLASTGLDAIASTATGMVEAAKAVWDRVLTGATHNIADSAGRRIRNLQEFGDYDDNRVWIDTINGSAGTTDYESGTILNKVNSVADSNTLGSSLGLEGRGIAPGSSIPFTTSQNGQDWKGQIWTLALGGQSISNTHIFGAKVSGICTGANPPEFHGCVLGDVTIPPCTIHECDVEGVITLPVGVVHIHNSTGESGSSLDYGAAIANTTAHWTDFSGDLIISNLGQNGTDVLDIRGHGKLILDASCVGGTVNWDGHITVTNNGSGITINKDDISNNVDIALTEVGKIPKSDGSSTWNPTALASINAEADTALSDYGPNTVVPDAAGTAPTAIEIRQEMDANSVDLNAILTDIAALNDISVADILDTPLTESYVGKGAQVSLAQGLYEVLAILMERANVSTSADFNKRDGTTPAFSGTMDDADNPTSITRTS